MSNIQTGAERMPHDLSHLGFLAGQIGRLITISTTPVIAGDSFEMDAVGALRLSPLRRGLAIDSTVEDRKSGSAGMPRPISYAVFCWKKKTVVGGYMRSDGEIAEYSGSGPVATRIGPDASAVADDY